MNTPLYKVCAVCTGISALCVTLLDLPLFCLGLLAPFRLSGLLIPVRLKKSTTRFDLMWKSSGLSALRLGAKFTSRTHGFKSESSKISKPRSSKQFEGLLEFGLGFLELQSICDSTEIRDLIIMS